MRISDWSSDVCSSDLYATVVTAPDSLLPKQREDILEARAVSYFMHREVGLPIVSMNGWDEAPMDRLVETGLSRLEYGQGDIAEARRQMAEAVAMLPAEWMEKGAAIGDRRRIVEGKKVAGGVESG